MGASTRPQGRRACPPSEHPLVRTDVSLMQSSHADTLYNLYNLYITYTNPDIGPASALDPADASVTYL